MEKEIGGFEVTDGIVIGPIYFSNSKKSNALMCPPLWAFNYGISGAINRLNVKATTIDEFQSLFNSILDDIIANILIYYGNRLKLITIKDNLKYKMNSIPECIKAYRNMASIDITEFCDTIFLKGIDRTRGDKHHSNCRYDSDYVIGGIDYGSIDALKKLIINVKKEINNFDKKLPDIYKDYNIKITHSQLSISVEWTAIKHAFDITDGGKIVQQSATVRVDPKQIKYFSIQINYNKPT